MFLTNHFLRDPIGDRGVMALAVALQTNTHLRTLNLNDQAVSKLGAQALGAMLKKNTHLEILSLGGNPIGLEGVKYIADGLKSNKALKGITLSRCGLGDAGAREVAKCCPTIPMTHSHAHTHNVHTMRFKTTCCPAIPLEADADTPSCARPGRAAGRMLAGKLCES